jgi:hypothetical protein
MSKGRKKQRIHRLPDPGMRYVVGVLKRLERRIIEGRQIPFMIVTIEPKNVPGIPEPVADPVVASRGINDPRLKDLRKQLLDHLVELGILVAKKKDADAEVNQKGTDDGLEVDLGP